MAEFYATPAAAPESEATRPMTAELLRQWILLLYEQHQVLDRTDYIELLDEAWNFVMGIAPSRVPSTEGGTLTAERAARSATSSAEFSGPNWERDGGAPLEDRIASARRRVSELESMLCAAQGELDGLAFWYDCRCQEGTNPDCAMHCEGSTHV